MRFFFGQFVRPFVASSREAASLVQLGSLRFGWVRFTFRNFVPNVSEAVSDFPLHVSVRPSCRCAPFRPTFQASERCRTIRYERRSWLRRMMTCHRAHDSARKIRRCTGREIGMAPCAEQNQLVGSLVDLRHYPSSLSTL